MTDHRITPPPELVGRIIDESETCRAMICAAYAAGADQELEACCRWLPKLPPWSANDLRKHRRPTPLSLKEQALGALGRFNTNTHTRADEMAQDFDLIRLALEALDD
jgi:hypothetical protein